MTEGRRSDRDQQGPGRQIPSPEASMAAGLGGAERNGAGSVQPLETVRDQSLRPWHERPLPSSSPALTFPPVPPAPRPPPHVTCTLLSDILQSRPPHRPCLVPLHGLRRHSVRTGTETALQSLLSPRHPGLPGMHERALGATSFRRREDPGRSGRPRLPKRLPPTGEQPAPDAPRRLKTRRP